MKIIWDVNPMFRAAFVVVGVGKDTYHESVIVYQRRASASMNTESPVISFGGNRDASMSVAREFAEAMSIALVIAEQWDKEYTEKNFSLETGEFRPELSLRR